ncbi:holin [Streptomyces fradiae]|uniref:holin n=1 Tax=Streptomyces fradiae TaxID=1906 RepID=UPI0033FBA2D0
MTTSAFWKATLERMVRTFAQAVLAAVSADGLGILTVDWGEAASVGALAAVLALLTAVATSGVGPAGPGVTEAPTRRGPTGPVA